MYRKNKLLPVRHIFYSCGQLRVNSCLHWTWE